MKPYPVFRFAIILAAIAISGVQGVSALPPAPVPISPAEGATIVVPTFTWLAATGAAKYEVEVGPQSDPNTVYWTGQTANLTLTPNDGNEFTNIPLYWRVRARDSSASPGEWSSRVNFTKHIPAPVLVSPSDASNLTTPVFEWQAVQGAAYYKVELSTAANFLVVDATYQTYNTRVIPADTIPHGTHYWRVSAVDAAGHLGTPSVGWSFTKDLAAPMPVSPWNGHPNVHYPELGWHAVDDATYYKVELSSSPTFVPVDDTYLTYNTHVTPVDAIANGTHYWRASSVDADGHVGTANVGWSFTKNTDGPVLVSPGVNASLTEPTMAWQAVDGAAYYIVELSSFSNFQPVTATYTTYNLQITPVNALVPATYYWRVSGVDAGGHIGGNYWRKFTVNAPPAAVDPVPQLNSPADTATITTDPTFSWSRVAGAKDYRLVVSQYADFHATYESNVTDYASYTPYNAGSHSAYPNGTYYWQVEARNSSSSVIATSGARSFTKQEVLPLSGPADGASGMAVDPTFQWNQIVGAKTYRLVVSKFADFHATYESIVTDYDGYTPYSAGSYDAYPNGTYYWKVEARNSASTVMVTSAARSFTKQAVLPLSGPADGASGLVVDPTFQWNPIVGARTYRLVVSMFADFHATYESIVTDYDGYTPYNAGSHSAYPNGTYYWQVEARNSAGTVMVTSVARGLTKQEPLALISPADGASGLVVDPTFQWTQIVGAKTYRLVVSQFADFHSTYDSVVSDYSTYTPYSAGTVSTYPRGDYYWMVQARNSAGTIIATSNGWSFSKGYTLYLPLTRRSIP